MKNALKLTTKDYTIFPVTIYKVFLELHARLYSKGNDRYVALDRHVTVNVNESAPFCDIGFYSKYGIFEQE
jgi:hypothetical protein